MKHLNIFEEFKIKKSKKIYKHLDKGKGGAETIFNVISDKKRSQGRGGYIERDENIDSLGDILKSVSKRFGLKSNVKYINSGSFGMAFVIDGNKIIKLTSSRNEAIIAKSFMGKQINHCVNYYDIVYIRKYGIYAILMDRAESLSSEEKKVISKLSDNALLMSDFNKLKEKFKGEVSEKNLKKLYNDFRDMYRSLKGDKISIQDLHEGNIGYLNGKMVHFDIMGDTNKKDIDKISKIKVK